MENPSPEFIKEIATQMDLGLLVYIHKTTQEIVSVPDPGSFADIDEELFEADYKKLKRYRKEFVLVEKWSSSEAFQCMEDFADQVADRRLKISLLEALSQRGPFRRFKSIIDASGSYRQAWFDFKAAWQYAYLAKQFPLG